METNFSIKLTNAGKSFTTSSVTAARSIKGMLTGQENYTEYEQIVALRDISLKIGEGERVGIIGHNGAGKTTLLNLIAGFTEPSQGTVEVCGKVNAVMSMGVVVREELTGLENIYIDGELHGKTKDEIDEKVTEIVEFADIGDYIHRPVRTYSSGMKARLSFAMLSFIDPEILIIDEVLGVGDAHFAEKSTKKVNDLCAKGKILLVVSHSMGTIVQMTERAILLDRGKIIMDGPSAEVAAKYLQMVHKQQEEEIKNHFDQRLNTVVGTGEEEIFGLRLLAVDATERVIFNLREEATVEVGLSMNRDFAEGDWDIRLSLLKMDGVLLMQNYASADGAIMPSVKKGAKVGFRVDIGGIAFAEGMYEVLCEVLDRGRIIASRATVLKIQNTVEFPPSRPEYYCEYQINVTD